MPTPPASRQLHALCHEHHVEMRTSEALETEYACPKADCAVRYSASNGYYIAARNGQVEFGMTPHRTCPHDGQPMYLAEINPEKRAFRLWRCPKCDSSRTNEENLINA